MAVETKDDELLGLKESWKTLSKEQLQKEASRYMMEGDMDKAQAILDFIKNEDSDSESKKLHENFQEKYNDFQKSLDAIWRDKELSAEEKNKKVKKAMKDFFKGDMKSYISTIGTQIDLTEQAKDNQINDLKAQLSGIVSEGPSLKEYFSLKRRRLVSINSEITDLEKETADYPKNVLIYLMAVTHSEIFGVRNRLKRGYFKALWKWKSDDIKSNLQEIEDKIKITPSDSPWTTGLKKQIQEHLTKAKQAFVDESKKSVGL